MRCFPDIPFYIACAINRAGKLIFLRDCVDERNRAGKPEENHI